MSYEPSKKELIDLALLAMADSSFLGEDYDGTLLFDDGGTIRWQPHKVIEQAFECLRGIKQTWDLYKRHKSEKGLPIVYICDISIIAKEQGDTVAEAICKAILKALEALK